MTKHYPRSHYDKQQQDQQQDQQQQQQKARGWYCKEHGTKYLCDTCGYESMHSKQQQKETKYYFIS